MEFDNTEKVRILNAIHDAMRSVAHHVHFGVRVKGAIEKALPNHYVYAKKDDSLTLSTHYEVTVREPGTAQRSLSVSWYVSKGEHWFDGKGPHPKSEKTALLEEFERIDPTDRVERMRDELTIADDLEAMETRARELAEQLAMVRLAAKNRIKSLPVPATAQRTGMRSEPHFWEKPSSAAKDRFPALFGSIDLDLDA